jgi:bifunctional DNA-binding transcriptional regulator/antitoxin component of YhaV-PrlF toxin-antitoxin module
MKTVMVKCEITIPVEMREDFSADEVQFLIEDNGCPGTGPVGVALRKLLEDSDEQGICLICNLGGSNKIVEK